ncbi:MAG TPA: DUF1552 domain-containing protein [Bryobacteraceae bacterium]|nr:DUF1552 domain-containing protein [Bryobacteraceae bacterium]
MKARISRRALLRGAGAAVGLPLLEAMGAAGPQPTRLIVVYAPSGKIMPYWTPTAAGTDFAFPRTLAPLERHRKEVAVLSGLAANQGNALGDGPGDHARAASAYLTGVHPRKTEGADIRCGVSMDQFAAAHFAQTTRLPSLEITCEDSRQLGSCDSYSCVYQSISWKSPTQPMAPEMNPRVVFERLFGDASLPAGQRAARRSVLDLTRAETARLTRDLGGTDKRKLDEYLTSIREVETRMEKATANTGELPEAPAGIPTSYREHARLLFDLSALAFASGATRMITFMLAREGGLRTYPEAGVPEAHHSCTHHMNKPELIEKVAKINAFHVEQFAYFLDKLRATKDGGGTLLDHTVALYGAGIGDPNKHDHNNLPALVAGGRIRGGQHIQFAKDTPIANLHLTLLAMAGVPLDTLGDSNGRLDFVTDLAATR